MMDYFAIVSKLIGPVQPTGETHIDSERRQNLIAMTELANDLLCELRAASIAKDRPEASMREIGWLAREFLDEVAATFRRSA